MHKLTMFLLSAFSVTAAFPQAGDDIEKYIKNAMTDGYIPGAAVAIIKNGKIVKESYYGYSNIEDSAKVTDQSVFEIASMSKAFTCAAILLLQQDGKISLNDPLSKYIDSIPAEWKEITIKQLMNHTSGLRDDWEENTSYFLENSTDEKMFEAQKKQPLRFKPGEMYNYSSGPFILGILIKKITGSTYGQFLEERIFKPLGMSSTSVYDYSRIVPHRVNGYIWSGNTMKNGAVISPAARARGDVGVITSLPDMIKWNAALKDDRLLNARSRNEMFSPGTLTDGSYISYGYGWEILLTGGHLSIGHTGGFRTGFRSSMLRFPGIDLDVIILYNQWYGNLSPVKIAHLSDPRIKFVSDLQSKPDTDSNKTLLHTSILKESLNQPYTNFKPGKKYFLGIMPSMIKGGLKDFTKLVYIDAVDIKDNPVSLFGQKITRIVFYRTGAQFIKYLSFNLNDKGEIVYIWPEFD
jgi:D-alanyl-D-alanine carboxypeptidase